MEDSIKRVVRVKHQCPGCHNDFMYLRGQDTVVWLQCPACDKLAEITEDIRMRLHGASRLPGID